MDLVFNAIGLAGTMTILIAYFLLQYGTISSTGNLYSLMNLLGALAILISLIKFWNVSVFILESIWAVISIYGLIRHNMKRAVHG
jgi:hypothetical protein